MMYVYKTQGICAKEIEIELDDAGIINKVHFAGGCPGNLIGIAKLVEGRSADEVIHDLRGTTCGIKTTSCPDQLALALEAILAQAAQ